jgi:hypothetical protein
MFDYIIRSSSRALGSTGLGGLRVSEVAILLIILTSFAEQVLAWLREIADWQKLLAIVAPACPICRSFAFMQHWII